MSVTGTADRAPRIKFSHLGLVVSDLETMQDFYTRVLGFALTDRGMTGSGATMAFMTLDPEEHHQVFLVDGKPDGELPANRFMPGIGPVLHHLSFRLASLAELRRMFDRLGADSERRIDTVTHGVCWAIYTTDPEGNSLEFFADTPWYITQPFLRPIDFSKSDEDLLSETEAMCRAAPGFRTYAAFNAELAARVPASLSD